MQRKYSLRKLSIGLASVAIGIGIINGTGQSVKADTVKNTSINGLVTPSRNDVNSTATNQSIKEDPSQVQGVTSEQDKTPLHVESNNVKGDASQGENEAKPEFQTKKDQKQDSVPKTQEVNDSSNLDAEKSIVRTSSLQEPDNQSNNHAEDNSQTQPQNSQKLDLTKNSKKFAKKVLATNLIATPSVTNGGFDEATWGKLDVNDWQGSVQDGLYQLTKYNGDLSHVIVPNEADFEQAGKSTNGLQVGITRDTISSIFSDLFSQRRTIAFSKTNDQKIKAVGTDWSNAFSNNFLSKFDGSNLDVSNVTNMSGMFSSNYISDLTSLAHWNVSNVTDMHGMFESTKVSDLSPLANWDTSKVTDMASMFSATEISDLTPLAHWNTNSVTNMSHMFAENSISDLTPLANWDTSKVTDMSEMFSQNSISNLTGLAKWDTSNVTYMNWMFPYNSINDLTPLANWKTSKVTSMGWMFYGNSISDLTGLDNWNTSKVIDMKSMFYNNSISNLTPLSHWDVSNVTDMRAMFENNSINNLTSLDNWNTSKVTDMIEMFENNSISNLTGLDNWNTSKVTYMTSMFANNPDIIDLKPIANWNISNVAFDDEDGSGFSALFEGDTKLDLTNIKNDAPLMQGFLKEPDALISTTFITNNADLVKATTGKNLPTLANTAKRTITFNIPHATPKTIVQTINYKTIAPVQIDWSDSDSGEIIKTYPLKDSDWQLDTSKQNDAIIVNGQIRFKPVKIPHINGYKAHLVPNKINPAMLMVSFMAVPTENKPSLPNEETLSKPSANPDNTNKPADDLQQRVVAELNSNDSGWTMPDARPATYTVEVPKDATIDLSDLVIAQPVHAQTRTRIHVNKRFKLSKKHLIKHLKHRKRVSKLFSKRYASL